jgi:hypothetical protein
MEPAVFPQRAGPSVIEPAASRTVSRFQKNVAAMSALSVSGTSSRPRASPYP